MIQLTELGKRVLKRLEITSDIKSNHICFVSEYGDIIASNPQELKALVDMGFVKIIHIKQ